LEIGSHECYVFFVVDSFSVDEAQSIIKQLKETNKNLTLQLTNSRESSSKVVHEKDAKIEQLQREVDAARSQQAQAVNVKEAVAGVEREWKQMMSVKEQEYQEVLARAQRDAEAKAQLERDWGERLSRAEQENAALLARFNKLQLDADSGRAFLLESNGAQEAELRKLREEAKQHDEELVRWKDQTNKQESELMKLRDETNKLLDELTQMVDEKDAAVLSIKHLEEEKRDLEGRLKGDSDVVAGERIKMLRKIDDLEDELEHAHDLCEKRR
jgi:chromosome segregation ATPase